MGLLLFKPNKSVKGHSACFTFNSKDNAIFLQLVKQTGWTNDVGTFTGGQKLQVKFSIWEVGNMIDALKNNKEYKTYHDGINQQLNISLSPYMKEGKQLGYGLKIYQTAGESKTGFLLGLTFGEAVVVSKWLENALVHIFDAIYSADIQESKEYAAKKNISVKQESQKVKEVIEENASDEDIF